MTLAPELVVEADGHITEPPGGWTSRGPVTHRDEVQGTSPPAAPSHVWRIEKPPASRRAVSGEAA
jgi:hypothetical protein